MSSTLQIRLATPLTGESALAGAVANVYGLDPSGHPEPGRDHRGIAIPAGPETGSAWVEVEPGKYLVEVVLPGGDVVSEQLVVADRVIQPIELEREPAEPTRPVVTPVTPEGGGLMVDAGGLNAVPWRDQWRAPVRRVLPLATAARISWIAQPSPSLAGLDHGTGDAWALLADALELRDPLQALSASVPRDVPCDMSSGSLVGLLHDGLTPSEPEQAESVPSDPVPRRYLAVQVARDTYLGAVPLPWFTAQDHQVPVELRVSLGESGLPTILMMPRDNEVSPTIAYMAAGSYINAVVVFKSAGDLLYNKYRNALAAALGGYILIATDSRGTSPMYRGEREPWRQWIPNLAHAFPWLPDGAIQHARFLLRYREGRHDADLARDELFAAYDRGLPYYSLGLKWLCDGLSVFRDKESRRRLAAVRQIALRSSLQQPFTVIHLSGAS